MGLQSSPGSHIRKLRKIAELARYRRLMGRCGKRSTVNDSSWEVRVKFIPYNRWLAQGKRTLINYPELPGIKKKKISSEKIEGDAWVFSYH